MGVARTARPEGPRTNVVRLLEDRGISHQVRSFAADPEHLDARTASRALGASLRALDARYIPEG